MRMWFRRKEVPWEVVGHKGAQPIPMYDEEDGMSHFPSIFITIF